MHVRCFAKSTLRSASNHPNYLSKYALDDVARAIPDLLLRDARISLRALGDRIGVSAPAVRERIRRLEDAGIIEGFTIRLNPRALGFVLEASLRVEPLPGKLRQVESLLEAMPEVLERAIVTGEDCFVARIVLRAIGDLDRLLMPLHDMARTKTRIVHRQPVPLRRPPF